MSKCSFTSSGQVISLTSMLRWQKCDKWSFPYQAPARQIISLSLSLLGGWVCKVIFVSNPTLGYFRLNWGWVWVLTKISSKKIVVPKVKVSKFGQNLVSNSWDIRGQMSQGQMLPGQMSLWQLASVKDGPGNLLLKFDHNQVSNSWYNPDMDKCYMDKCCLDKCHFDTLNLFKMIPGTYV